MLPSNYEVSAAESAAERVKSIWICREYCTYVRSLENHGLSSNLRFFGISSNLMITYHAM
jgi:hypothetical protein